MEHFIQFTLSESKLEVNSLVAHLPHRTICAAESTMNNAEASRKKSRTHGAAIKSLSLESFFRVCQRTRERMQQQYKFAQQ